MFWGVGFGLGLVGTFLNGGGYCGGTGGIAEWDIILDSDF